MIAREGDTLVRIMPGLPTVTLIPASDTQFFDKVGAEWRFDGVATGRATAITQRFRDREWRSTRVE